MLHGSGYVAVIGGGQPENKLGDSLVTISEFGF